MNRRSVSLPRPLARFAVLATSALIAVAASVAVAGSASAHVSVSSQDAAPDGYGKITFRVPNESDTASTVGLRIQVPQEAAVTSLSTQAIPGWTVTRTMTDLPEPLESHGEKISSYASVIEFRADPGGGIAPGEFQEFSLSGGPFPKEDQLVFPTVQVYSDGSETAWIEPTVQGQGEPEHPAPVLALAADTGAGTSAAGATTAPGADHSHEAAASSNVNGPTLFLAILALLVAVGGVVLGWRASRRTVSS
jgi:periplasmic copper chaperone A